MKKGEKAEVIADAFYCEADDNKELFPYDCSEDSNTTFEIELLDFYDKELDKWDYTNEERIEVAKGFKDEGNAAFKAKDMEKAKEMYTKVEKYLEGQTEEEAKALKISVKCNLSLIHLREKNYKKAVQWARESLDIDSEHVKSRYRRAAAYIEMGNYEDANEDIKYALNLDPANKPLKALRKKALKGIKANKKKEKSIYANFFK